MAAFLDLYGGYSDLAGLLEELARFEVTLDPMGCHPFEQYTYVAWCAISALLAAIGLALYLRDSSKRVLFRQCVVLPAVLYVPILLGFSLACLASQQTQEHAFGVTLMVIEPLLCAHVLRLIHDALRNGLNARFFDLPLSKGMWRFLLFSLFFHVGLVACGAVVVGYADGPGRLLLALEGSLRLRFVRPHPTTCPESEIDLQLMLLGTAIVIVLAGHCTVNRTVGSRPYRTAWRDGVTLPALAQAVAVGLSLTTCLDTQASTEVVLYGVLAAVQLLALLEVSRRVYVRSRDPARWLYIGLVPYQLVCLAGSVTCLLWSVLNGPLMAEDFVVLWERVPQPGSVHLVFFSLILLHLVALQSIALYDPDESEREPTADELAAKVHRKEAAERRKRLQQRARPRKRPLEVWRARLQALRQLAGRIRASRLVSRLAHSRRRARAAPTGGGGTSASAGPVVRTTSTGELIVPPPPARPPPTRPAGEEDEAPAASAQELAMRLRAEELARTSTRVQGLTFGHEHAAGATAGRGGGAPAGEHELMPRSLQEEQQV